MKLFRGLSGRLLAVTVAVVMAVEVCIFVPSVSRFRVDFLEERIARAHLASLAVIAAPDLMVTEELERELLAGAEILNVVLQRDGTRALMLKADRIPEVTETFDLREMEPLALIGDALERLLAPPGETVIRIIGVPENAPGQVVEVVLDAEPLRVQMMAYGIRILQLSLIISLFTAVVVFLSIRRLVVGPLLSVIENVKRFQENPEDPERIIRPSGHSGEVAEAEAAIAAMQADIRDALRERARLASLGEAVAKISHDLRNMLAAQQLMMDRLEMSRDPVVARVAPKLMAALDRAIRLCQRTLDFGKAEEPEPELREVALAPMLGEVAETLGLADGTGPVSVVAAIPEGHTVSADPEQLYRVLANLMRNADEAIRATGRPGEIRITAFTENGWHVIRLADTGPGLPQRARAHLFKPFRGSARRGGTGLGLSIAHDLVAAHAGTLTLVSSTTEGTVFEIRLPLPVRAAGRRRQPA